MRTVCWVCLVVVLAGGCARSYRVQVDAINQGYPVYVNKYALVSGMAGIEETDLHFQEFAKYVERGLAEKSYWRVPMEEAEAVIAMSYGVGSPQTHHETDYFPYYGPPYYPARSGVSTSISIGYSTGGAAYYHQPYWFGGTRGYTRSYETYRRFLALEAYDMESWKNATPQGRKQLWKVIVSSRGTSEDLRSVMPVLAAAAYSYIDRNTHGQVSVKLQEEDQRLKVIEGMGSFQHEAVE